jgi:hypothetical protein
MHLGVLTELIAGLSVRTGVGVYIGKVGGQQSSSLKNCRQIFYRHLGVAQVGGGGSTRGPSPKKY